MCRAYILKQISLVKVDIAIITQCTQLCEQLSKGLFKQNKSYQVLFLNVHAETRHVLGCNGNEFQSAGIQCSSRNAAVMLCLSRRGKRRTTHADDRWTISGR